MDADVESMISKMERSRARLNAVLVKIGHQTEIYPTWKVKQVMDHIAGWDDLVSTSLRTYMQGEIPARAVKGGIDHFNAESVAARKAMSVEESRRAYDSARAQVLEILRQLPADMLRQRYPAPWGGNCTIPSIVKIFVSHEQEHAKQIEELL